MRVLPKLVVFLMLGAPAGGAAQQDTVLVGTWTGALQIQGTRLRIVVNIAADAGGYRATMDSPDQGATGIPVQTVQVLADTVRLGVPSIGGSYEGVLLEGGRALDGTWRQGGGALPLRLERGAAPAELRKPQEPQPPFPYDAEDVTFANPDAPGVRLAGTLTTPRGNGPFPTVVLVSGSGPQNRDEELLGHKPFLVLADALTRRGIAVLRYDDRGVGESTGTFGTATSEDFASDARAAVSFVAGRPRIDGARVGVLGHSEGGLVAPMVAMQSEQVAFLVLLAAPAVTGEEILIRQGELIARANGATDEAIAGNAAVQRRVFEVLRTEASLSTAAQRIEAMMRVEYEKLTPAQRGAAGVDAAGGPAAMAKAQAARVATPWFRFFLAYDPAPALRAVDVPVLALYGGLDLQVPPAQNAEALRTSLEAGGNRNVRVRVLPGLNHLFQEARTGSPNEYAAIEQTMAESVMATIAEWVLQRNPD